MGPALSIVPLLLLLRGLFSQPRRRYSPPRCPRHMVAFGWWLGQWQTRFCFTSCSNSFSAPGVHLSAGGRQGVPSLFSPARGLQASPRGLVPAFPVPSVPIRRAPLWTSARRNYPPRHLPHRCVCCVNHTVFVFPLSAIGCCSSVFFPHSTQGLDPFLTIIRNCRANQLHTPNPQQRGAGGRCRPPHRQRRGLACALVWIAVAVVLVLTLQLAKRFGRGPAPGEPPPPGASPGRLRSWYFPRATSRISDAFYIWHLPPPFFGLETVLSTVVPAHCNPIGWTE